MSRIDADKVETAVARYPSYPKAGCGSKAVLSR
jgi:hypothetical protein